MHKDLQEKLNTLGNTPLQEPKLYKLLTDIPLKKTKLIKSLDINIKNFTALEIAEFYRAVAVKVQSYKEEESEVFKTTPNTEDMQLPDFEESEDIQNIWIKMANSKDNKNTYKQLEVLALKISGLDVDILTEWETKLVIEQILSSGVNVTKTALGNV